MCLPICSPMAPSPIIAVRLTSAILNSRLLFVCLERGTICVGRGLIDREAGAFAPDHDAVVTRGRPGRDVAVAHVDEHALGLARERIAVAAAAWRIEAEDITGLERIIGIACRQPLGIVAIWIDPDVACAAGLAAGAAVRWDHMFHRADREARVLEIEIFAADAEPAAEAPGAAGVLDQLETNQPRRELALDDLDRRDHGVALVHRDAGGAVLAGASASAARDDFVLHVALASVGAASAQDDGAAAAAVGAYAVRHDVAE